jgi:phosphate/sulfate permease
LHSSLKPKVKQIWNITKAIVFTKIGYTVIALIIAMILTFCIYKLVVPKEEKKKGRYRKRDESAPGMAAKDEDDDGYLYDYAGVDADNRISDEDYHERVAQKYLVDSKDDKRMDKAKARRQKDADEYQEKVSHKVSVPTPKGDRVKTPWGKELVIDHWASDDDEMDEEKWESEMAEYKQKGIKSNVNAKAVGEPLKSNEIPSKINVVWEAKK